MSEKNHVSKRKETYRAATKKVKSDRELYNAFRKLNSSIPQRKRRTPLNDLDLQKMDTAYRETLNTLNTRIETLTNNIATAPDETRKQKSALQKLQNQLDYYTKIRKTLSKDLKAIMTCRKLNPNPMPNITQFYESARSKKLEFDLRKAKKYGDGTSTRYRITVPGTDGFFTISKRGLSVKARKQELIDDINNRYGENSIFDAYNPNNMYVLAEVLLRNNNISDMVSDAPGELIAKATFKSTRRDVKVLFIDAINETNLTAAEKNALTNTINNIKPGELVSLIEYMNGAYKINNVDLINNSIGIGINTKQDKRNSAMSMVADLIGCKDLIAPASTLQIKDPATGRIISGTLMENAKGTDIYSTKREDLEKFNQLTPDKIENSLQLKKDIANLQILDWLCGNADRHKANVFYKFDEAGNLVGVVGIDNDLSFGKGNHATNLSGIHLENMNVITKETADRIMTMNKEEFRNMLYGYDLSTTEVNNALGRLDKLRNKIEADQEYFKDMPADYVENGRIRVVDDEQLAAISMYEDLGAGMGKPSEDFEIQGRDDKNLFATVCFHGKDANGILESIDSAKKGLFNDTSLAIKNSFQIEKQIKAMDASERKTHNTHQPFRDMIKAFKDCKKAYSFIEDGLARPKFDGSVEVYEDNIRNYRTALEESIKKCDLYMKTKDAKKIMKMSKTSNGYERYMLAKESKEIAKKSLEALDGILDKNSLIDECTEKFDAHKATCENQLKAIRDKNKPRKLNHRNTVVEITNKRNQEANKANAEADKGMHK